VRVQNDFNFSRLQNRMPSPQLLSPGERGYFFPASARGNEKLLRFLCAVLFHLAGVFRWLRHLRGLHFEQRS
jgi:hypothetical protein